LLSSKSPIQTNFPDMVTWGQKIWNLLGNHIIARLSGSPLLCVLKNRDDGRVQVALVRPGELRK
jgi:hypothetical protein